MEIFTTRWHLHQTFLVCWVSFWKIFIQGSPAFVFTFRLRSKLFSVTVLNWIQPFPFKLLIWAPSEDKYFSMWLRFRKGPLLSFFLWNGQSWQISNIKLRFWVVNSSIIKYLKFKFMTQWPRRIYITDTRSTGWLKNQLHVLKFKKTSPFYQIWFSES